MTESKTEKFARAHQSMILAHRAMAADLQRIIDAADKVPTGRCTAFAAYAQRIETIIEHHHEGEDDFLWPALRERGADLGALDLMSSEHAQLSAPVHAMNEALATLAASPAPAHAIAVGGAAQALREVLVQHCADEEADLGGRLSTALDETLWKSFEKHMVRTAPKWTLWFMPPWLASVAQPDEMWAVPGRPIAALGRRRLNRLRWEAFGAE